MNIAKNLENSARLFPDRPAVSEKGRDISYAQLDDAASRIASGLLKAGISQGDRVVLCAPNSSDWIAFYFGVIKAGAVAVTLSDQLKRDELLQLLTQAEARAVYASAEKRETFEELSGDCGIRILVTDEGPTDLKALMASGDPGFRAVERRRDETAAILFTGGTTGIPKGAMLSHENINTALYYVVYNERSRPEDRAVCFLPFNHVFGQMHILNATILSSSCVELMPSFEMDRFLEILGEGRVTKLFAVPTVYVRLLSLKDLKDRLGNVRYCFSAATSMAAEIVRQWKSITDLAIHEAYGMTESASMVTYNHFHHHVIGSVGTPAGTTEVRIMDLEGHEKGIGEEGEICILGRNIMKGYLNQPEETKAAFRGEWLRSGDLGYLDDNGYLFIVDRLKDMIITGGENVYPREIEELLHTRSEVAECAVIGLPDKEWGERVTALMTLKPGMTLDTSELRDYLRKRLAPFKVPKEYQVVGELPKSAAGKILKRELKKQVIPNVRD